MHSISERKLLPPRILHSAEALSNCEGRIKTCRYDKPENSHPKHPFSKDVLQKTRINQELRRYEIPESRIRPRKLVKVKLCITVDGRHRPQLHQGLEGRHTNVGQKTQESLQEINKNYTILKTIFDSVKFYNEVVMIIEKPKQI